MLCFVRMRAYSYLKKSENSLKIFRIVFAFFHIAVGLPPHPPSRLRACRRYSFCKEDTRIASQSLHAILGKMQRKLSECLHKDANEYDWSLASSSPLRFALCRAELESVL